MPTQNSENRLSPAIVKGRTDASSVSVMVTFSLTSSMPWLGAAAAFVVGSGSGVREGSPLSAPTGAVIVSAVGTSGGAVGGGVGLFPSYEVVI